MEISTIFGIYWLIQALIIAMLTASNKGRDNGTAGAFVFGFILGLIPLINWGWGFFCWRRSRFISKL